jgi:hypothetical protein
MCCKAISAVWTFIIGTFIVGGWVAIVTFGALDLAFAKEGEKRMCMVQDIIVRSESVAWDVLITETNKYGLIEEQCLYCETLSRSRKIGASYKCYNRHNKVSWLKLINDTRLLRGAGLLSFAVLCPFSTFAICLGIVACRESHE